MSIDSMEDRIYKAGTYDRFNSAVQKFLDTPKSRRGPEQEGELYDEICNCGATPEEADEYVDLLMQGGD